MKLTVLRRAGRLLASPRFATVLLLFLGSWSVVGSLIPQGADSDALIVAWASSHPVAESVVRLLGLHQAFSAPLFAAVAFAIAVSTAACAWQRTSAALRRARALREASASPSAVLAGGNDVEIECAPCLSEQEILDTAERTLGGLGIRARRRDDVLGSVSASWSAWGSPVFHWALVAVMAAVLIGGLTRSSGLMGLAVGEAKADAPGSYGYLQAGPLHDWRGVRRIIRVDAFDVRYTSGGVDRGPTPTVSILDADGKVLKSQLVYPNNTLNHGSLTIYPSSYGLATIISMTDASGAPLGRSARLADFSEETTEGTVPASYLVVHDSAGDDALKVLIAVPLDATANGFVERLPAKPAARVVVTTMQDAPVLDAVLRPGQDLPLPTGGTLQVDDIVYYARLQLVDDPSIPLLYAGLVIAVVGLGIGTLARQQIVLAGVVRDTGGPRLALRIRLWRNASSSRDEIVAELTRALSGAEKGDAS